MDKKSIQVFFPEEELALLEEFKTVSGRSYSHIAEQAILYFIKNDLPYVKEKYRFYNNPGEKRKSRKQVYISKSTYEILIHFIAEKNKNLDNDYSVSGLTGQACMKYLEYIHQLQKNF